MSSKASRCNKRQMSTDAPAGPIPIPNSKQGQVQQPAVKKGKAVNQLNQQLKTDYQVQPAEPAPMKKVANQPQTHHQVQPKPSYLISVAQPQPPEKPINIVSYFKLPLELEQENISIGNSNSVYRSFLKRFWDFYKMTLKNYNQSVLNYRRDYKAYLDRKAGYSTPKGQIDKELLGTQISKFNLDISVIWRTEFSTKRLMIERKFESTSCTSITLSKIPGEIVINQLEGETEEFFTIEDCFTYDGVWTFEIAFFHYVSRVINREGCIQFGYRLFFPIYYYANEGIEISCSNNENGGGTMVQVYLVKNGRDVFFSFICEETLLEQITTLIIDRNETAYLLVDIPIKMQ